jgi:lambda repressor-like predicted transcriptional regulator
MAEAFSATLFSEARAHHETARRWFCIAVAGLAIFHAMIFTPYLDLASKKREATSALVSNQKSKDQVEQLAPDLAKLQALSSAESEHRLNRLLGDLRADFGRLNQVIAELHRMGPDEAADEAGARLFGVSETPADMPQFLMAQMPMAIANAAAPPQSAESSLPSMTAQQRREIAAAGASEPSLIEAIRPYVEQQLIKPKFRAFNQSWQKDVVPAASRLGEKLLQNIRTASQQAGEQAARGEPGCEGSAPGSWSCLADAVSLAVRTTEQFAIEPPADAQWWRTVQGKGETFNRFQVSVIEIEARTGLVLAALRDETEKAVAENKKRQDEIDRQIAQLNEESQKTQQELAGLIAPLKSISLDLTTIVPYFPLILGIAFVALTSLLASRLQELGVAVAAFARENAAGSAIEWLHRQVLRSPWHRGDTILARAIGFAAWVSLASWQLVNAKLPQAPSAVVIALLAAASAIGIGLASAYEWRVARSLDADEAQPKVEVLAA